MAKGEERQKKKVKAIKGKGKKVAEEDDEDLDAKIDAFIADEVEPELPPPPKERLASAKKVADTSCKQSELRKRL